MAPSTTSVPSSLVGDPRHPRRNVYGGLFIALLGALQLGLSLPAAVAPGRSWAQISVPVAALVFLVSGVAQVRLGVRYLRTPLDHEHARKPAA